MRNCWPNREGWERGDRFNGAGVGGYFMGGRPATYKSLQRGTVTIAANQTSGTATVTSVSTSDSRLRILGWVSTNSGDADTDTSKQWSRITLTNATTITATRNTANVTYGVIIRYELAECTAGIIKQVQRGTVSGTGTATITSTDTTKTELDNVGVSTAFPSAQGNAYGEISLTNATTITGNVGNAGVGLTFSYQSTEQTV